MKKSLVFAVLALSSAVYCADNLIKNGDFAKLTADGKAGEILRVLNTNGYLILVTHWQSLMSNGLGTGLRVMEEVARRIEEHLSDRVVWMSFSEILEMVLADKAAYPKPIF